MNRQQKEQILHALRIGETAQMSVRTSVFAIADIHDARLDKIRAAIKELEAIPTTEEV